MHPIEMIYLFQTDVLEMGVTMPEVINLVEKGLHEHGKGWVENINMKLVLMR